MLHLRTDTYSLREIMLIIVILSYPIKYLHIDLEGFSRNRTAVLGDFFFNCSMIGSEVGLNEQSRLNITEFPWGCLMLRRCHFFVISTLSETFY